MKNCDYRQAAAEIIAMLTPLSLNDWARKIDDSILRSESDTEALITLRHTLKDMKENQLLPSEITRKVTALISELTKMIDRE